VRRHVAPFPSRAERHTIPGVRLVIAVLCGVGVVVLEVVAIALAAAYVGVEIAGSAVVLTGFAIMLSAWRNRRRVS